MPLPHHQTPPPQRHTMFAWVRGHIRIDGNTRAGSEFLHQSCVGILSRSQFSVTPNGTFQGSESGQPGAPRLWPSTHNMEQTRSHLLHPVKVRQGPLLLVVDADRESRQRDMPRLQGTKTGRLLHHLRLPQIPTSKDDPPPRTQLMGGTRSGRIHQGGRRRGRSVRGHGRVFHIYI